MNAIVFLAKKHLFLFFFPVNLWFLRSCSDKKLQNMLIWIFSKVNPDIFLCFPGSVWTRNLSPLLLPCHVLLQHHTPVEDLPANAQNPHPLPSATMLHLRVRTLACLWSSYCINHLHVWDMALTLTFPDTQAELRRGQHLQCGAVWENEGRGHDSLAGVTSTWGQDRGPRLRKRYLSSLLPGVVRYEQHGWSIKLHTNHYIFKVGSFVLISTVFHSNTPTLSLS